MVKVTGTCRVDFELALPLSACQIPLGQVQMEVWDTQIKAGPTQSLPFLVTLHRLTQVVVHIHSIRAGDIDRQTLNRMYVDETTILS